MLFIKIVNNCLNNKIYSYLEISGGQSSNLYLNVVHFSTPGFIKHLWQPKAGFPELVPNTYQGMLKGEVSLYP